MKLFGWEDKVNEGIAKKRDAELRFVAKRKSLNVINNNLTYVSYRHFDEVILIMFHSFFIPLVTMAATFACYVRDWWPFRFVHLLILFPRPWSKRNP